MAGLKSKNSNRRRTICEVHREIYDCLLDNESKEKIIELLEEAFELGKKMVIKLRQYKGGFSKEWYEENKNREESLKKRENRED
jgi:hypothetical protein